MVRALGQHLVDLGPVAFVRCIFGIESGLVPIHLGVEAGTSTWRSIPGDELGLLATIQDPEVLEGP